MNASRRDSIKKISMAGAGLGILGTTTFLSSCSPSSSGQTQEAGNELFFQISLAQWSLHRSFLGSGLSSWEGFGQLWAENPESVLQGALKPVDFPKIAKQEYGLSAIEYVNIFYFNQKNNLPFWQEMKTRCDDQEVKSLLIMCDREGNLGDLDDMARKQTVENHYGWIDAAKTLGCHSIRVNAAGEGSMEDVKQAAIDGLGQLSAYGAQNGINVIVENHGGYSSNGAWLSEVIRQVNSDYCGTLPDFGNFCLVRSESGCAESYDRYQGIKELMPFARGVSAKSHDFNEQGEEINTDFTRMLQIVKDAGFTGYIDIEYEGNKLTEPEGIRATHALLKSAGAKVI